MQCGWQLQDSDNEKGGPVLRQKKLTVSNTTHLRVTEDSVLAPVGETAGLLDEGGRKTVGESLVVHELGGDVVIELENVLARDSQLKIVQTHIVLANGTW